MDSRQAIIVMAALINHTRILSVQGLAQKNSTAKPVWPTKHFELFFTGASQVWRSHARDPRSIVGVKFACLSSRPRARIYRA